MKKIFFERVPSKLFQASVFFCFLAGSGCFLTPTPEKGDQGALLALLASGSRATSSGPNDPSTASGPNGPVPALISTSPSSQGFQSIIDTDYTFSPTQPQGNGTSWVEQVRHKRKITATFNGRLDISGLQNPANLPTFEVRDDNGTLIPGTIDFLNSLDQGEVQFIPTGLLPVNQTIHVKLSGLRSESGAQVLSQPLQFTFTTSRATAGYDPFKVNQTLDVRCKGTTCKIRLYPTADIQAAFSQGILGDNIFWYVDLSLYTTTSGNIHVLDFVFFEPDVPKQTGVAQPIFIEFSVARSVWRDTLFNRASGIAESRHMDSTQMHSSDNDDVNSFVADGNFEIVFSEEP